MKREYACLRGWTEVEIVEALCEHGDQGWRICGGLTWYAAGGYWAVIVEREIEP